MEAVGRLPLSASLRALRVRVDPPGFAAWLLPLLLIVYLGLNNGGYDVIERSQAGIVIWWIVLVGTAVGMLPVAGGTTTGRVMLALLVAFAGWTALSLGWTESAERTSIELGRVAAYLGVFALALAIQGEGRWRHFLNGVTTGVVIVAGLAVLSRLEPTSFPDRVTGRFLGGIEIERRLAYPLNYSSGLAAFCAIGLPLLLAATASARTIAAQALAAAALPVLGLALWLTGSSLAIPAVAVSLVAFLVLAPDRIPRVASLLIAVAGSAILIAAEEQRDALDRGLPTPAAQQQGDELLVIVLVVCAGVALMQAGISFAVRYGRRPAWLRIPREAAAVALVVAVGSLAAIGVAGGLPGEISDQWQEFKGRGEGSTAGHGNSAQIFDFSGSGRYEFWQAAVDASKTEPLVGIGPGTFEFWWARNASYSGFIKDAHSLYLETLAELGIIGLILLGGFVVGVVGCGAIRAMRSPPELRLPLAAATAACLAFATAAGLDWDWELGVLPAVFLMLAATCVVGGSSYAPAAWLGLREAGAGLVARGLMVALSVAALLAIALPLAATNELQRSQSSARGGDLGEALASADAAESLQPYAATPHLQKALVLERQGRFAAAADAAREATRAEATNWRTWLTLSRLEARRGDAKAATVAYRRARALNPRSGALAE
jgi:O-Antigen ligase